MGVWYWIGICFLIGATLIAVEDRAYYRGFKAGLEKQAKTISQLHYGDCLEWIDENAELIERLKNEQ